MQVSSPHCEFGVGIWVGQVAAGQLLPRKQEELHLTGFALEARIYAERPGKYVEALGVFLVLPLCFRHRAHGFSCAYLVSATTSLRLVLCTATSLPPSLLASV